MKIAMIQVGKTKATYLQEAEREYLKRLGALADIKIITVKECSSGTMGHERIKEKEAAEILRYLPRDTYVIALEESGRQFSSVEFAGLVGRLRDFEGGDVTFVTGGCYGLGAAVIGKARLRLSFGRFTYTHELIRTLLLEQLYRAFTIMAGKKYHY